MTVTIANGFLEVSVDPLAGGRISSLKIAGVERLVVDRSRGPIGWGFYVMAPWAGRMRHGEFRFEGATHRVPCDLPPHAIHGTTYGSTWTIDDVTSSTIIAHCRLGDTWPRAGSISHHISIDGAEIHLALELHAEESMPAQVGWHPWFAGPGFVTHDFRKMYVRGTDGIPTGELIDPTPGPHDDCFVDPLVTPRATFDDGTTITMHSDCTHWVVYDEQSIGFCVEPQSGPPNAINDAPEIIATNTSLRKTFDLTCACNPQIG